MGCVLGIETNEHQIPRFQRYRSDIWEIGNLQQNLQWLAYGQHMERMLGDMANRLRVSKKLGNGLRVHALEPVAPNLKPLKQFQQSFAVETGRVLVQQPAHIILCLFIFLEAHVHEGTVKVFLW